MSPSAYYAPSAKCLWLCLKNRLARVRLTEKSGLDYWRDRAGKYGVRGVLNLAHQEKEVEGVTRMQLDILVPLLKSQLRGDEEVILDFGCGPGRFTPHLAAAIGGHAVGVDPIPEYLAIAPPRGDVEYRVMTGPELPVGQMKFDVVWICLVLGGIVCNDELAAIAEEIERVLAERGLVFLVENTSPKKDGLHWKFRSVGFYQELFRFCDLKHLADYQDLDERISVLAGRKKN